MHERKLFKMVYDFYKFDWKSFETLTQSLAQNLLGKNSIVFGDGADGGRELTFLGPAKYPNDEINEWNSWLQIREFPE